MRRQNGVPSADSCAKKPRRPICAEWRRTETTNEREERNGRSPRAARARFSCCRTLAPRTSSAAGEACPLERRGIGPGACGTRTGAAAAGAPESATSTRTNAANRSMRGDLLVARFRRRGKMLGRSRFQAPSRTKFTSSAETGARTIQNLRAICARTTYNEPRLGRKSGKHLVDMRVGLDAPHDVGDVALGIDQERRALDAHVRLAVELALAPDAVAFGNLVVGIRQQRERQAVLLLELHVRRFVIRADAEDDGPSLAEGVEVVPDPARLRRTARRVVLGIEVDDDRLAPEVGEPNCLAGVALEL